MLLNCLLFTSVFGQNTFRLDLTVKGDSSVISKKIPKEKRFRDSVAIRFALRDLLQKYWHEGYLEASVDAFQKKDSLTYKALVKVGKKYRWVKLKSGNVNEGWLRKKGYSTNMFKGDPLRAEEISQLMEAILEYAENHGHPFAAIRLAELRFKNNALSASLKIDKGPRVTYGDLTIPGKVNVSKRYLRRYLKIDSGRLYNENDVKSLKDRIDQLAFLKTTAEPGVDFQRGKAHIKLYLKQSPASRVNGIVGVSPQTGGEDGLRLTGEVGLRLRNPFGQAMSIDLNWQKIRERSQELRLDYHYPFFLNFPIGAEASLDLIKFDTLYLNVGWELGVRYLFSGNNYGKVFYESSQSNLINPSGFKRANNLSQFANYDVQFYGIGANYQDLDYRLNPTKGYRINLNGSAGQKSLNPNPQLEDRKVDSLKSKKVLYKLTFLGQYFFKLGEQTTLMAKIEGKHLVDDKILRNQLFQFGGFQDLRGFDEGSISASSYGIGTLEFRLLTAKNDYFTLFFDQAFYQQKLVNETNYGRPYGFGLGYTFETGAGLFSLNYAIGQQSGQPLQFRNGQIHFGFINLF